MGYENVLYFLRILPGLLLGVVCHEAAHAWTANRLGDPTARMLGRISLNPLRHMDVQGTLILPLVMFFLSGGSMLFAYAKPVPITLENFKHPRRDSLMVSLAGPGANLFLIMLVILAAWILRFLGFLENLGLSQVLQDTIHINLILAAFNLLPIPPLDGASLVASLLPGPWAYKYQWLAPYGFLILIGLYWFNILPIIFTPLLFLFQLILFPLGNPFA